MCASETEKERDSERALLKEVKIAANKKLKNLMLHTFINFPPSSTNPNEEDEISDDLYFLNPKRQIADVLVLHEVMTVRFAGASMGLIQLH